MFELSARQTKSIQKHRQEIKSILDGQDERLLVIVGPCSAWPDLAVYEYAKKLHQLQMEVTQHLKFIMRVYPHKSRTQLGWHGPLYQPNPFLPCNIKEGMKYTADMIKKIIDLDLPIASEIINIRLPSEYWHLFSWLAVGARCTESPEHRIFASSLNIPVGLKNSTHGSTEIGINSVLVAQTPNMTVNGYDEIKTDGNPYAHLVLRGADKKPNFSNDNLENIANKMQYFKIKNPAVLIDVSHDNAIINEHKNYKIQPENIFSIMQNIANRPELKKIVKGFMIESFIKEGCQNIDILQQKEIDITGLSITDPCISWETTEKCLRELNHRVTENQ